MKRREMGLSSSVKIVVVLACLLGIWLMQGAEVAGFSAAHVPSSPIAAPQPERAPAPPRKDSRPSPMVSDTEDSLSMATRTAVTAVATELSQAMPKDPVAAGFCSKDSRGCAAAHDNALYYAIEGTGVQHAIRTDSYGIGEWLERDRNGVRDTLFSVVAKDTSEVHRVAALLFLRHQVDLDESEPLPTAAYGDLAHRAVPEIDLICQRHIGTPLLDEEAVQHVASVALHEDMRARRRALVALGHPQTATELSGVLPMLDKGERDQDWNAVARALSSCGLPCQSGYEYVLALDNSAARIALYEQLTFAPTSDRPGLAHLIDAHTTRIVGDERTLRDSFLESALN